MLVSAEESGKYFLLGEKCTSNGQLWVIFIRFFFITVATTISVGYFATKIALILECVYLVCESVLLDSVPWKENEQRFLPSNHSTSIRLDGVEKLTKAKRKRSPDQGLHRGLFCFFFLQRSSKLT